MELSSLIVLLAACAFKTWASKAYDKHLKPKLFLWEEKYVVARVKREATLILTTPVILYFVKPVADRFLGQTFSYWAVNMGYALYYDSLASPREDERPVILRARFVRQVLIASKLIWFVTFLLILYGTLGFITIHNNFSVDDVSFHYTNATMSPTGLLQEQRHISYRICGFNGISSCFLCRLFQNFPVPVVMAGLFYVAHLTHFVLLCMAKDLLWSGWEEVNKKGWEGYGEDFHFMPGNTNKRGEEGERRMGVWLGMIREMRRARGNNMVVGAQSRSAREGDGAVVQ